MTIYLPVVAIMLGAVLYLLPAHAKVNELGRLSFFAGALVTLFEFAGKVFHL